MLPAVVVLNAKYFPDSEVSAAKVGATSFALSVVEALREAGTFAGMILYRRQEGISTPSVTLEVRNSVPCATLTFNFGMRAADVQDAIAAAAEKLATETGSPHEPMLYYQTDTLLDYHPERLPCCVTHHGPFHGDFSEHFSAELAALAFGSHEKARHLQRQQESGIHHLRRLPRAYVLQHSRLQREYLVQRGVDPARIRPLSPPIQPRHRPGNRIGSALEEFIRPDRLLLFTAVARLDYFKNVELLLDAGIQLLRRGLPVDVLIAGDESLDLARREKLLARVPAADTDHVRVVAKLPKDELYALFDAARDNGIFVCPSRYETLGITPLEAALSGVTTVITDSPQVEAAHFFPPHYRFRADAGDLAALLQRCHDQGMRGRGEALRRHIGEQVSDDAFRTDLLSAWGELSDLASLSMV